ncbi:MAG: TetR/AcrR family transcriptional regulator [Candidatus Izemoplasma sp.]
MKEKILKAAYDLIIENGIMETTLKAIALEVGISKGTLYYYYSAKEDLIFDVADAYLKVITDDLLFWIKNIDFSLPPEKIIYEAIDQIVSAETRGKLNLYLISKAITNSESLKKKLIKKYEEWQATIKEVLDNLYQDQNNEGMSFVILTVIDGLIIQKLIGIDNIPIQEIANTIAKAKKGEKNV